METKLLLIIAYQLQRQGDRGACPFCGVIGGHHSECNLKGMEEWVKDELYQLWRTNATK